MVEFALVFPIFIIVLTSILYFGFLLYSRMTVINAARAGARYGITLDLTTPAATFTSQVTSQVTGAATVGLDATKITPTLQGFQVSSTGAITGTACSWGSGGTSPACKAGDAVQVQVTYPFGNPVPMHLALLGNVIIDLPSSFTLSSTVLMIHE
jgi:Flp pilus assembly protein TadG